MNMRLAFLLITPAFLLQQEVISFLFTGQSAVTT